MSAGLVIDGLAVSYGLVEALHGASLTVAPRGIVTVVGPNGAGKSTMLNAIMGVLPYRGRVLLDGEDLGALEPEARVARGLCLVPEKRELFTTMSVEDNLLLGGYARYRRRERGWRGTMDGIYQRFPRLAERRRQLAGTLSGGERQMLALGRALMGQPRVLMLDEPSLGLAPRIVREIFHIIADLHAGGVAILLVEQNARAALRVAEHGYVLEAGAIVTEGPSQDLANDRRVLETYLGVRAQPPSVGVPHDAEQ